MKTIKRKVNLQEIVASAIYAGAKYGMKRWELAKKCEQFTDPVKNYNCKLKVQIAEFKSNIAEIRKYIPQCKNEKNPDFCKRKNNAWIEYYKKEIKKLQSKVKK